MLPVLCINKLASVIIIVIINSSWIKLSHQQQQLQSEYPFDQLNQFELSEQNNRNLQSGLINNYWLSPGQELIFATTTTKPLKPLEDAVVFVNNQPAVATMIPFIPAATTPTPEFLDCLRKCPTTSEFNPVCASNRQQYGNEQKFICAKHCGADIEIVRRGSCEGLFPMARG